MAIVILLNLFDDVTICNSFLSTVFKFYRPTVLFTDKPLLLSHTLSFIIYVQALPSRVHTERRFFMTESDLPEYFYKELTPDQQKELCDFIKNRILIHYMDVFTNSMCQTVVSKKL